MGPTGKLGAYHFAMTRGFTFDAQRKYHAFFDAFVGRGRLRKIKANPTHIFKEGDFRPVRYSSEEPQGDLKTKQEVKKIFKEMKPLEAMTPSWLHGQKKEKIVAIAVQMCQIPEANKYNKDQLVRMIMARKLEMENPLPQQQPAYQMTGEMEDLNERPIAYGEEDRI